MLDSLIHKDIELLIYLNNLGSLQWDGFWLFITNKYSAIPLYLVLLYFTYKYYGLKRTFIAVLFVVLLITVSDQTCNLFKYGFKRLRPCHDENVSQFIRMVKDSCGGLYGYFSAHAANSMSIAVFFGLLLKRKNNYLFPILIIWALAAAYSRIYIGVHYPLDVITGVLLGVIYGTLFYKLYKLFLQKFIKL